MQHIKKPVLVILVMSTLGWGSCKTTEQVYTATDVAVPASYAASKDTVSARLAKWTEFFNDTNLVAIMKTAIGNNFDVRIAQQRVEMARNKVLGSRGALSPTVGLNTFGSNIKYGRHTMDGAGNATTPEVPGPLVPSYMVGVASSWEVDLWGKLRNKSRAAQTRYLSTEMGRSLVITSLLSEIAYRYYELVSLDAELEIIRRNIKLQEAALEIVKVQKSAGRATELAVKQFSAQLLHTQGLEAKTSQAIIRMSNEINLLAGRYADDVKRDASIFEQTLPEIVKSGIPATILSNRPDLMQAELELKATKYDVAAAKAAFLPSLAISAHAGYNTYHPEMLFDPVSIAYGLIGTVTGPLLNRKQYKANYGMALAENKEAYLQYGKAVMSAVYEVKTTLKNIENLQQQYSFNEQEATTLTESIDIAKDLYLAGYANYLEVITAQKSAVDAGLNLVKTRKDLFAGTVDLYRALGGGWR